MGQLNMSDYIKNISKNLDELQNNDDFCIAVNTTLLVIAIVVAILVVYKCYSTGVLGSLTSSCNRKTRRVIPCLDDPEKDAMNMAFSEVFENDKNEKNPALLAWSTHDETKSKKNSKKL